MTLGEKLCMTRPVKPKLTRLSAMGQGAAIQGQATQ